MIKFKNSSLFIFGGRADIFETGGIRTWTEKLTWKTKLAGVEQGRLCFMLCQNKRDLTPSFSPHPLQRLQWDRLPSESKASGHGETPWSTLATLNPILRCLFAPGLEESRLFGSKCGRHAFPSRCAEERCPRALWAGPWRFPKEDQAPALGWSRGQEPAETVYTPKARSPRTR